MNSKQSLFLRYFVTHSLQPSPFDGKNPLTETLSGADDLVNSGVFGDTLVISPAIVNSFRATYNRSAVTKIQSPSFSGPDLGINMTTLVPGHVIITAGSLSSASVFSYAAKDPTDDHQLADDLSVSKEITSSRSVSTGSVPSKMSMDRCWETGAFPSMVKQPAWHCPISCWAMSPPSASKVFNMTMSATSTSRLYAQDNWKATSHLTLNYGVRWEPYIGGAMATGYVSHFDPALFAQNVHSTVYPNAPAGLLFPGDPGFNTNDRPSHTKLNDLRRAWGSYGTPKAAAI